MLERAFHFLFVSFLGLIKALAPISSSEQAFGRQTLRYQSLFFILTFAVPFILPGITTGLCPTSTRGLASASCRDFPRLHATFVPKRRQTSCFETNKYAIRGFCDIETPVTMEPLKGKSPAGKRQGVTEASQSRVVPKPVPAAQEADQRGFQITQVRRRYSPHETNLEGGTTSIVFKLPPSDPDFPFELDFLECDVHVPKDYPEEQPVLHVRNKDIPRGFGINIEKGWASLVSERKGETLLGLLNALDKNLESFLSEQKAETVKLVTFKDVKDTRHVGNQAPSGARQNPGSKASTPKPKSDSRSYVSEPSYTREQIADAKARRAQETRQLEARMGRMPQYRRAADGVVYTLPIEPKRRVELPSSLRGVKTLHLIIPVLYPLQPLRVQLNEADAEEAEPVEELFAKKAAGQAQMSLMSQLNYLAANLHILAKMAALEARAAREMEEQREREEEASEGTKADLDAEQDVRAHVKVIPRPPEWTVIETAEAGEESDSESSFDFCSDSDGGGATINATDTILPDSKVEKGTAIYFPSIELHGVELLQVSLLSLNVKCDRCKTINEVANLRHGVEKSDSCRKCANSFAVKFTQQLVHQNSTRAGLIDTGGCTVADMLPSTFVPVCSKCSTPAAQGFVSVQGDGITNVCRECHAKFTFKIPEIKFLRISPGSLLPANPSGNRRNRENLGLHAGEPLPDHGACQHYRKSYRWFRFSCCGRVHPCDKCHDEAEGHVNEWASRMTCGWCSREQRFAPEVCGFCGRSVVGRRGKGFWEGGKGTRNRTLMSRKDRRKFKRVGGTEGAKKD